MRINIFLLLFIFFANILYAQVQVQNMEIKQENNKIELILTLNDVYNKPPRLSSQNGYRGVIFPDLQAKSRNESFKNFFVNEMQIFNIQNDLYVLGIGDTKFIDVSVSRASRAFKITFNKITPPQSEIEKLLEKPHQSQVPIIDQIPQSLESQNKQQQSILPFKNDIGIDTWRYVAVLAVMSVLVLVLWFVKRYMINKKQFGHYLARFGSQKEAFDPTKIEVVSQKNLDSKHRILTIESNGYRYLILIGATNTTLIDRYPIPQNISTQERLRFDDQFTKLLEQKQERLSKYLHNDK
ncbi:flagellar biosynthetic protein FliO [Helicobacter sp. MIT 21-1697]|uniref:flagellar biosynthetic protein FliO n=1 Tax=Helicobacter sp. MIT 21-1697 TaxID=2993733 RepID=UPI00224A573A|nr:flagellar biosynthetic protein FliO [Helicobacter sp. MIT 21-1697]MCX2717661.1 flagellar biosynthetic protein FliO [Helicobacter sp. MIT 21-1697]